MIKEARDYAPDNEPLLALLDDAQRDAEEAGKWPCFWRYVWNGWGWSYVWWCY